MKINKLKTQKLNKVLKRTFLKENNRKINTKKFNKAKYRKIITNQKSLLRIALLKKTKIYLKITVIFIDKIPNTFCITEISMPT
jgi:hypothetical protein